jgi:hypothetical protein
MRRWLEWLDRRPENVIVQDSDTRTGSSFCFGAYPEDVPPQAGAPRFTRVTFFALQKRGWVEPFLTTEERYAGRSFDADGRETRHFSRRRFWRITAKGKQALTTTTP